MPEHLPHHSPEEEPKPQTDPGRVKNAVEFCAQVGETIPHDVARVAAAIIAAQDLDNRPSIQAFARTGAIDLEDMTTELQVTRQARDTPIEHIAWVDALRDYVANRDNFGPVEGWQDLWVSEGLDEHDNCTICGEHRSDPHHPDCVRGDLDAELQEPGPRGDIRRLLHDEAGGLFGREELKRMENAMVDYLKAHYVPVDEVADMIPSARYEELTGITHEFNEAINEEEEPDAHAYLRVVGRVAMYLESRERAMRRLRERKPE